MYQDDPPELQVSMEAVCAIMRAAYWQKYADGFLAAIESSKMREATAADLGIPE